MFSKLKNFFTQTNQTLLNWSLIGFCIAFIIIIWFQNSTIRQLQMVAGQFLKGELPMLQNEDKSFTPVFKVIFEKLRNDSDRITKLEVPTPTPTPESKFK